MTDFTNPDLPMDSSGSEPREHSMEFPTPVGNHQGSTAAGKTTKTEAPTNAGTYEALDEVINDKRLTEEEHDFVSLVDMHWGMHGELLSIAMAKESYQIAEGKFVAFMGNPNVRAALTERGVSFRGVELSEDDAWRTNAITPHQLLAAKSLLDITDTRSDRKKLQDLGIDTKTFNAWRRDPIFMQYMEKFATELLKGSEHEVSLALLDKIRSGDVNAIKFWYEFMGKWVPKTQNVGPEVNMQGLLTRVLEIILEEVKDGQVRARISERLLGLGNASNLATTLVDEGPIPIPEVMPARELSADLKELKEHGVGVNI